MKNPAVWAMAVIAACCLGLLMLDNVLGPDESDMLAAESLAEAPGWSSVHSTKVSNVDHDIEVIRVSTDTGPAGVTVRAEICSFDSKVGGAAPEPKAPCKRIISPFGDQLATAN